MGRSLDSAVNLFRRLLGSAGGAGTSDGELLDSFVRCRDERAFEDLVERHGPMVLGVCKRVLRDSWSADDAFQVTFLTLACKASSLLRGETLPAWLHRTAFRIALHSPGRARRIGEVEKEATPMTQPEPLADIGWRELSAVVDEEIQQLPDNLRGAVVLCGLEGKTHEEAARELGWAVGSFSKRLARAREVLKQRLAQRGFEVGSVALTAGVIGKTTAAVPETLLDTTVRGAGSVVSGQAAELSAATAALCGRY